MVMNYAYGRRSATCINPIPSPDSTNMYSNYPTCASIPDGCTRCDDVCSERMGLEDRYDYDLRTIRDPYCQYSETGGVTCY